MLADGDNDLGREKMRNGKHAILKALFSEAKRLGIDQETLRDDIAHAVIHKRLSKATPQEIAKVLVYIHKLHGIVENPIPDWIGDEIRNPKWKRYESSRDGLLQEIKDLAIARFGQDFIRPLNALCERFRVEGYRSLRVNQAKAVKQTLLRLQREDPRHPSLSPSGGGDGGGKEKVITFYKHTKGVINQLPDEKWNG